VKSEKERVRRYRRYMYHAGSIDRPDRGKVKMIDPRILKREKRKGFDITWASRMRYRTRYFTDSGIIGSKAFVAAHYQWFKDLFQSKSEKIPKPIQGLSGIYSLKRLSETIRSIKTFRKVQFPSGSWLDCFYALKNPSFKLTQIEVRAQSCCHKRFFR